MLNAQTMMIIALSCAAVALAIGIFSIIFAIKSRAAAARTLAVALQLESELSQLSKDLDMASHRTNDYSRRVAWLESRASFGNIANQIESEQDINHETFLTARPSITERRHRVLSLARRGLDTPAISNTLGVPHGEVDLIINLNSVA